MARIAELADGTRLEFPDGTSDEVIDRTVRDLVRQQQPRESAFDRGAVRLSQGMDALTTTPFIGGTVRALRDRAQGIAQVVARPFASEETMRDYERMRQGSEQTYQDFRTRQGDTGVDIDRVVGGAAIDAIATSRLMGGSMRNPLPTAPTMLGRAGQGAKIGATAAAMQPVDSSKEGAEFWLTKGIQSGAGAAVGGIAPVIFEPLVAGMTSGVNKVVSTLSALPKVVAGRTSDRAIEFNLSMQLKAQGIDWGKLGRDVQESMVRDVRAAVKSGEAITPDQLSRYADFKALTGAPPTRGQLTLDPMLVKQEQNLKGITGVGEELTRAMDAQNARIFAGIDDVASRAGSPRFDARDAGVAVAGALDDANRAGQQGVRDAYTAAKNAAGLDAEVPLQRLAQTFGEMRDQLDMKLLPGPVKSNLASFGLLGGKQTKVFTIADAEDLLKTINRNYNPRDPAAARAMDEIRRAVQSSVDDLGDSAIPAAEAFRTARRTAADRFQQLRDTPALAASRRAAQDRVEFTPDNLIENFVLGKAASASNVENLIKTAGPAAHADIKAAVIGKMRDVAQGRSPTGAPQFQYAAFSDLVDRIGPAKLKAIFSADEVAEINRIVRVGSVMNFNPRSVTINRAGTSQALIDLMGRVQGVPFLNRLVASPVMSAVQQNQAYNAANAGLAGLPGGLLSDALRARIAEQGGLIGAAAVAPLPGLLAQ
jgi:hypothetical protein